MGRNLASDTPELLNLLALKEVLGGFAHEIRQPLNAFSLACDVIRLKVQRSFIQEEDANFILKQLARIADQVRRTDELVKSFREFSRPSPESMRDADLRDALLSVIHLMKQQFVGRGVELQWEEPPAGLVSGVMFGPAQSVIVQALAFVRDEAISRPSEADGDAGKKKVHARVFDTGTCFTLILEWSSGAATASLAPELEDFPGLVLAAEFLRSYGGGVELQANAIEVSFPKRRSLSA
jgi:hypothetical protein